MHRARTIHTPTATAASRSQVGKEWGCKTHSCLIKSVPAWRARESPSRAVWSITLPACPPCVNKILYLIRIFFYFCLSCHKEESGAFGVHIPLYSGCRVRHSANLAPHAFLA